MKDIIIATPVRRDMQVDLRLAQWVTSQILRAGIEGLTWRILNWDCCPGNYIDAQRNWLVESHRAEDAILFLDSDVVPPPDAIDLLVAVAAPVAVGLCPIVLDGLDRWNVDAGEGYLRRAGMDPPGGKRFPIVRGGTACMLIDNWVFDVIEWPWFKTVIRHATRADRNLVECTDDEWFCDRLRQASVPIVAEPRVICDHPY
jgi:GT2 family glycosyltransferase